MMWFSEWSYRSSYRSSHDSAVTAITCWHPLYQLKHDFHSLFASLFIRHFSHIMHSYHVNTYRYIYRASSSLLDLILIFPNGIHHDNFVWSWYCLLSLYNDYQSLSAQIEYYCFSFCIFILLWLLSPQYHFTTHLRVYQYRQLYFTTCFLRTI